MRDLRRADPAAASCGRMAEATAAAASMVTTELRLPLCWRKQSAPATGDIFDEGSVLSSIRLLEGLENANAVRLPDFTNAKHLFCALLQHGLKLRPYRSVQPAAVQAGDSDSQWQAVEPRLTYLLKISPNTISSVESLVQNLASLIIDKIIAVDWTWYGSNGQPIVESERKTKPVSRM